MGFTILVQKIHIFRPNISLILYRTTNVGCNTKFSNYKADHICRGHYIEENKSVDSSGNKLQLGQEGMKTSTLLDLDNENTSRKRNYSSKNNHY